MVDLAVTAEVTRIVEALLAKRGGARGVGRDESLTDAGLTSLDMVNLMLAVEDAFGVEVPQKRMTPANFRSIAAIEVLIGDLALAA
ncbi:MAG: phosphopantetheine-binding protein [Caulobacteraceae bacterium]